MQMQTITYSNNQYYNILFKQITNTIRSLLFYSFNIHIEIQSYSTTITVS